MFSESNYIYLLLFTTMMATVAPAWQIIARHPVCRFAESHFAIVDSSCGAIGTTTNCFMVYFSNYILLKIHWREGKKKSTRSGFVSSLHGLIKSKRRDKFSMALQTNCSAMAAVALDGSARWKLHSNFVSRFSMRPTAEGATHFVAYAFTMS